MVKITSVERRSRAARAGLREGDTLISINENEINDVLDYRFYLAEERIKIRYQRGKKERTALIKKQQYDDIGLDFETPLMDKKQTCKNGCIFCFIDQLPKGMRESLYFKDDDTRLSFLHGNYVTLTNLSEEDIDRIIEMRISPINVSVHTTDPDLRVKMMKNKRAGEVLSYLRKIADAGLSIQGQIVLCKGINDGEHLRKSLRDLATYHPALQSVSVVPVGLSAHREGLYPLEPFTKEDALEVISTVEQMQKEFLETLGTRLVWLGDEFYLKAELPIPEEQDYEGYPQIENGVGMIRSLTEEAQTYLASLPKFRFGISRQVSIATGIAAAPTMREIGDAVEKKYRTSVAVYAIRNDFFGHSITVSGLLTGQDIVAQLQGKPLGDVLLISQNCLRAGEQVLLDDMTVEQMEQALGVKILAIPDDGQALVEAILQKRRKGLGLLKRLFGARAK